MNEYQLRSALLAENVEIAVSRGEIRPIIKPPEGARDKQLQFSAIQGTAAANE